MSDCFTEAMKPKYKDCCPYCGQPTPRADVIRDRQHSIDEQIKNAWSEKDAIEQRYQQLEQVAKSVSHSIGILMDDETVKKMPMLYLCMNKMHCQLEIALG